MTKTSGTRRAFDRFRALQISGNSLNLAKMQKLRETNVGFDIAIGEFSAHRCVLSARSPYFRERFASLSQCAPIIDMPFEVGGRFSALLDCLYGCTMLFDECKTFAGHIGLYLMASFYGLEQVQDILFEMWVKAYHSEYAGKLHKAGILTKRAMEGRLWVEERKSEVHELWTVDAFTRVKAAKKRVLDLFDVQPKMQGKTHGANYFGHACLMEFFVNNLQDAVVPVPGTFLKLAQPCEIDWLFALESKQDLFIRKCFPSLWGGHCANVIRERHAGASRR
jgi:hypothetical protein